MSIEKLHHKQIVAESITGEQNTEAVVAARLFNEELENRNEYILGSIMQGSQFKGYSSETSDIDLSILWNSGGNL